MEKFPVNSLTPKHAVISRMPDGSMSIEILMTPFLWNQEIVDTSIRLDGVDLPSDMLKDLAGKSFKFPTNSEDGYIDGSIYLGNAHHPVDVTSLDFNVSRTGSLKLIIKGIYQFEFEGLDGVANTPFVLAASVSSCAV
ncbi:MAG: hypothetical protein LBE21_09945 [Pseudomonadales bacterium]|jgi:hypothetical protein|nr:hypothetical protein [Pseudomonadales bacterium]